MKKIESIFQGPVCDDMGNRKGFANLSLEKSPLLGFIRSDSEEGLAVLQLEGREDGGVFGYLTCLDGEELSVDGTLVFNGKNCTIRLVAITQEGERVANLHLVRQSRLRAIAVVALNWLRQRLDRKLESLLGPKVITS